MPSATLSALFVAVVVSYVWFRYRLATGEASRAHITLFCQFTLFGVYAAVGREYGAAIALAVAVITFVSWRRL